jgi:hypothetical protein
MVEIYRTFVSCLVAVETKPAVCLQLRTTYIGILKFLTLTNALIYTYKMSKHTVKISRAAPTCFGTSGPSSGSYR